MRQLAILTLLVIFAPLLALAGHGAEPTLPKPVQDQDFRRYSAAQVKLGQLLFYDRVLSGTYRVSCATCHNPDRAGSNGFPLDRKTGFEVDDLAINGLPLYEALKPSAKHAPALFNLGAKEFTTMFGDGRVARRTDGTFLSPAGEDLPTGLQDVLAVQALFPAVTGDELVGTVDNDVKAVAHLGNNAVWQALTGRVQNLPEYWPFFQNAYPELKSLGEINITHIANALSAFVGTEWRSDTSPFDAYLRGDKAALTQSQLAGLNLFYGKAQCSSCHSGPFQTDHDFHAVATPLWRFDVDFFADSGEGGESGDGDGDGEGGEAGGKAGFDLHLDRSELTGRDADKYRRRTPSLRNVEFSAPYGHAGSFGTLPDFVKAHLDPAEGLQGFVAERTGGRPPPVEVAATVADLKKRNSLPPVALSKTEFEDLIEFLKSLSQADALSGKLRRPEMVPSSLALD
ncbi:MAG: cytochrome c peroxidase [Rhizobiaceae bacterium]